MSSTLLSGTVIRSRVVMSTPEDSGLSSVVTDGVTIQGDGTAGSPIAVIAGVYDPAGSAAAALISANSYTDTEVAGKQDALTNGSGTTVNGAAIDLGGAITSSASLPVADGVQLNISTPGSEGGAINAFSSGANTSRVLLASYVGGGAAQLSFGKSALLGDGVKFTDARTAKVGIQYSADYSADFTARSLVDKAYVDSAAGGGSFATITGDPYDNAALSADLNEKLDALETYRPITGAHTLDATDLASINAGESKAPQGDDSGTLTVPTNATVAFPIGTVQPAMGFTSVVAAVGVTITGTRGDLTIPAGSKVFLEQISANNWTLYNGEPAASSSVAGITKLYTSTGSNTDGAMDQNSITNAINSAIASIQRSDLNMTGL